MEGWEGCLLQKYMIYKYEILKESVKILYNYIKRMFIFRDEWENISEKNVLWATQFLLKMYLDRPTLVPWIGKDKWTFLKLLYVL